VQKTSELYQELLASNHKMETRLAIGETGVLITKQGDAITFGDESDEAETPVDPRWEGLKKIINN
jgi:hypothetical protein